MVDGLDEMMVMMMIIINLMFLWLVRSFKNPVFAV